MSEEYQVINNSTDVDKVALTYFSFINGKYLKSALECFAETEATLILYSVCDWFRIYFE
ncbi:hypothetical protein [Carnobacterium maltaromaticum]